MAGRSPDPNGRGKPRLAPADSYAVYETAVLLGIMSSHILLRNYLTAEPYQSSVVWDTTGRSFVYEIGPETIFCYHWIQ